MYYKTSSRTITLPDPAGHFTAWLGRPLSRLEATVIRQLEYLRYRHLPVRLLINDPDPDSNRIPLLLVTYFRYLDEHLHLPSFQAVADRTKSHAQLLTRRLRTAKLYSGFAPNSLRGANANHLLILNAHSYPHSRVPASLLTAHCTAPAYKRLFQAALPLSHTSPNSILIIHGTTSDPRNYFTHQFRHHAKDPVPVLLTLDLTADTPSPVVLTFEIPLRIYLPGAPPDIGPPGLDEIGTRSPDDYELCIMHYEFSKVLLREAGATAALNVAA